jgi:hypothetical protein
MGFLVRLLLPGPVLRPLLKPLTRLLIGALAVPLFRLLLRRVIRLQDLDKELEKDLEQWFRASLLLLAATANMEHLLFSWMPELMPFGLGDRHDWMSLAFRLLLAIGVIEAMPDQALFSVIHPGPPPLRLRRRRPWWGLREQTKPLLIGLGCQHLNRSSPVLAIMAAIFGGNPADPSNADLCVVGWVCYALAIAQYLVIGLVTSKDKAVDVLAEFDRQVAMRRDELVQEFGTEEEAGAPVLAFREAA